ncbi:hypothetical protein ABPG72_013303 [Tetrahymena utriculariae]
MEEKIQIQIPFSKIGGLKEEISQLRYMIELPFKFGEVKSQKVGLLLYGQPGCGKTLIARELSKALGGCYFKVIQGPELMNQYVGESEEQLRNAFQECINESLNTNLPSILFFDEVDAVLSKRNTSDTKYEVRFVDQFLTCMDGFYDRGNLIVIGATNRPEVIDPAAKRTGRFDKEIEIKPPETKERVEIFNIFLNEYSSFVQICQQINSEFIFNLCEQLENYNGSDINGLFKQAYEICKRRSFIINQYGHFQKVSDMVLTPNDFLLSQQNYVPYYKRI